MRTRSGSMRIHLRLSGSLDSTHAVTDEDLRRGTTAIYFQYEYIALLWVAP